MAESSELETMPLDVIGWNRAWDDTLELLEECINGPCRSPYGCSHNDDAWDSPGSCHGHDGCIYIHMGQRVRNAFCHDGVHGMSWMECSHGVRRVVLNDTMDVLQQMGLLRRSHGGTLVHMALGHDWCIFNEGSQFTFS